MEHSTRPEQKVAIKWPLPTIKPECSPAYPCFSARQKLHVEHLPWVDMSLSLHLEAILGAEPRNRATSPVRDAAVQERQHSTSGVGGTVQMLDRE